jgi:hypothetical protein
VNKTMTYPKAPTPIAPVLEAEDREKSRVRRRPSEVHPETVPPRSTQALAGAALPELSVTRPQRLARALRFARLLRETMAPNDEARKLLDLAITRQDEPLLEAILKDLYQRQQRRLRQG